MISDSDTPDARWERVGELFGVALEQPPEARTAFLARVAAADPALAREVESLLDAHPSAVAQFDALAKVAGAALAAVDVPAAPLRPGDIVGHYHILGVLGAGGMGQVYRARDTHLERTVALKFIRTPLTPDTHRRLLREAQAAAALDHPHLCTIYGIETHDGQPFIVMAYYEGQTLREKLRHGAFPAEEALTIAGQIASGLVAAHDAGIVHRDLKPGNILLTRGPGDPHVHLLDFGVAHLARAERLTHTGQNLGTVGYMAPEQVRGEATGPAADLWALGVVLYEMLAGRHPFAAESDSATLYAVLEHDPPPLRTHAPSVPDDVEALVTRLLQKDPAHRYPSAHVVRDALHGHVPADSLPAPPVLHGRKRLGHRLIAALGISVLLVAALWLFEGRADVPAPTATMVAVMPFAVSADPQFDYLREGLVDLLSTLLDGVGDLRTVDPNALLGQVPAGEGLTIQRAQALAAHFHAGRFVLGRVTDTGTGLRLHASLYRPDGIVESQAEADVPEPDALLTALDGLARQLVASYLHDSGQEMAGLAARTTASFDALRAYLDGERLLRATRFAEAEAVLAEAVSADSTFALAWYRLARAAGWTGNTALNEHAIAQALRFSEALPERMRDVLLGYRAFRLGDPYEADQRYRAVLARYPDDAETWLLLGELTFHYNPYMGHPTQEALEPLTRARSFAPHNAEILVHLMELAAQRHDPRTLDSLSMYYLESKGATAELDGLYHFLREIVLGDSVRHAAAFEALRRAPLALIEQTLVRVTPMLDREDVTRRVAALLAQAPDPAFRAQGLLHTAFYEVRAGRWSRADSLFDAARTLTPGWVLVHHTLSAAAPGSTAPATTRARLRTELMAWEPPPALEGGQHTGELPAVRRYLLALLDLREGHSAAALEAAARLERAGDEPEARFGRSLAATLRAGASLHAGRYADVLRQLDAVPLRLPFPRRQHSPLYSQHLDRLLRVQALRGLGRGEEADRWAALLHDGYYHWGAPYRSLTD